MKENEKIKLVSDTINKEDLKALSDWLTQDEIPQLTKGSLTWELEAKWAKKLGTKYSVFVNSGSSAILLILAALKELNKGENNKIVVPALSWLTDVSSPIQLGMEVILCDCNLVDLSCDLNHLEEIFKKENPKYFILVSALGFSPKMDEVLVLCERYGVTLIEDVCESMGSNYNGKKLGTFGKASLFSTYFGHHISTIEGGFINTNDEDLYYVLLALRSHGWARDLPKHIQDKLQTDWKLDSFESLYGFYYPGFNLRSTDLQAFLGLRAINKLEKFSQKRNENYKLYKKLINQNELILTDYENSFNSNFAYPIVSKNREKIVEELFKNNIEVRPLIAGSMGNKPFWVKKYGKQELKNADIIDKYGFYVPNHQDLTENDISRICEIINFFNL